MIECVEWYLNDAGRFVGLDDCCYRGVPYIEQDFRALDLETF